MTMLNAPVETLQEFLVMSRRLSGHTTRSLGALVGVSSATVSNWEAGKGEPTATQFVRWCQETKQPLELAFEGLREWSRLSESNRRPFHYE